MADELLTIADIAALLRVSPKTVRDRLAHRPDFPAPDLAAGPRSRLWLRTKVIAWATPAGQTPFDAAPEFPLAEVMAAAWNYRAEVLEAAIECLSQAKRRAPRRNLEWDLEPEDIAFFLWRQSYKCAVSGAAFSLDEVAGAKTRPYAPSIDRIDSRRGYVLDNVRLVCMSVNFMMNAWGDEVYKRIASQHADAR